MKATSQLTSVLQKSLFLSIGALLAIAVMANTTAEAQKSRIEVSPPGLGETMSLQQMRHAKLWFAGDNGNWELARYELDELHEGFDDAIKYNPTHDGVPGPLAKIVPVMVGKPLAELDKAIAAKDRGQFALAFDDLTTGCNSCHRASHFGFNHITRPTAPPYSNQDFRPLP